VDPACPSNHERDPWLSAMLRGDFAEAWEICDRVLRERLACAVDCSHWPRHQQFIWRGHPIDGRRVLVRCYHGLGDTLQFARLLAPLRKRAQHVTLWVQPALVRLLEGIEGVDELHALHDGSPALDYDVDIELMEIPHILRLSLADLPGVVPYVHADASSYPLRRERFSIGISWRSGSWNESRSIVDEDLMRLAQIAGVEWFSLQYGHAAPDFMTDIACTDIAKLASRMLNLDLVISVDTMVAHLAGALALPTWTLLPERCDWRWMREGEATQWYPTMRLFRQRNEGDWPEVLDRVVDALHALLATRVLDTRSSGCTASSG
jgi:hypothetical protein